MLRPCRSASTLACTSVGLALHEEFLEQLPRASLGGDRRAAAGEAERRSAFAGHGQRERGIARAVADLLGGKLVERDAVAEAAALGVRRAGEEAALRGVTAGDARQADAGKDGEVLR